MPLTGCLMGASAVESADGWTIGEEESGFYFRTNFLFLDWGVRGLSILMDKRVMLSIWDQ